MSYETILVEQRGSVTLVTLNRPQALNALNSQVLKDLIEVFGAYDADDSQHCLVLTGSEKAFAAGADIKEMSSQGFADMYSSDFFAGWEKVTATRKPWIAAVAGYALGGGCEVAMMADFIIAADSAKFGQPEIKLGVTPGMGGSQRLTWAVGKAKAMEMCLTGRMMGAEEAERSGLVAKVVPAADLLDEALKTAEAIAAMPPLAAIATKEMVNAAFEIPLGQGIRFERRLFHGLFGTEDQKEGMAAFVEKRPGNWKGPRKSWRKSHSSVLATWAAGWRRTSPRQVMRSAPSTSFAEAVEKAKEGGCSTASSAAEAVKDADVVITMLPAAKHVRAVFHDDVAPNAKAGALLIDCSTIDVQSARDVGEEMKAKGFDFVDAPVSGGIAAAAAGTLALMVGGTDEQFERAKPFLEPMAKAVIHAGQLGAGQAAKICNNMILGATMAATCEGFALAKKLGLDLQTFFDISSKASGQSWSMTSYCPVPGSGQRPRPTTITKAGSQRR